MAERLSSKQQRILDFIREFVEEAGYPPTVRDIVKGCGLSSTSVADYNLRLLERQGYFKRRPQVSRGIELSGRERGGGRVPLIGYIAAGAPLPVPGPDTWHSSPLEMVQVPPELVGREKELYALRVRGTSMIDALIDDGDVVLMRPAHTAENGEMVAVWLREEREVTLKKFYHEGERIRLQPANSQLPPLFTTARNVEIQGKVVAVLRRLG